MQAGPGLTWIDVPDRDAGTALPAVVPERTRRAGRR